MKANNEALLAILRKSHEQALAGNTVSMDEVEHFMLSSLRKSSCSIPFPATPYI